jgi:hypothetical protein
MRDTFPLVNDACLPHHIVLLKLDWCQHHCLNISLILTDVFYRNFS